MTMRPILLAIFLLPLLVQAAPVFKATVVKRIPHSRSDFTQGLEIHDGILYQSTGQYGASKLQTFKLEHGSLLAERELEPQLFGEGITLFEGNIYQLTWRSGRVLIYRRESLQPAGEFTIPGEGWGLTNNGNELIYSDGSDQLHVISPQGMHLRSIPVRHRGRPVQRLNELEWTPEYILANVWGSDWIVMIDPGSGNVIGRIDTAGLLPRRERKPGTGVLNGIARNPQTGQLWLTGKNWPWLYQIDLKEK